MKEEKKEIELIVIVGILILAIAVLPILYSIFSKTFAPYTAVFLKSYAPVILVISQNIFGWILGITIPVSILLLIGIVASVEGIKHIRKQEEKLYDIKVEMAYDDSAQGDPAMAKKWQTVMLHVDSPNASDWRQAIIDADSILAELLTKMQYPGAGVGEQLMAATKADFNTLDQAWEAHKVRNQIAHEGSDFKLSQHEAKRIIGLYKQVFEEFFYI